MKINKGKSICVFGVKGGTGKSTLVLNLAGMYARLNLRVLIVDFDLNGGSVALHLGKNISKTIYNFADDYNNNRFDNILSYVTKYNDNIDFIAAPKDPRQANKIDNKYVHILVEKAVFQYDVVLIEDAPYEDLKYTNKAYPCLKSMDTTGQVLYFGSFSKVIAPGFRLGYSIATPEILSRMIIGK